MNKITEFIEKKLNWEYWPTWAFYLPNIPYLIYLGIRAKNLVFFNITNPVIRGSGNGLESKFETLQLLPEKYKPKSILVLPNSNIKQIKLLIDKANIKFPLIAKPDIGFRGLLVIKINTITELEKHLVKYPINFIIQEFIDYNHECGIFYYREPDKQTGTISSITLKNFLFVTGDGISTLKQLILKDKRARLYINLFSEIHQEKISLIPKKNEIIKLTVIGNHSKGTQFINGNHLISNKLIKTFDNLSKQIDGWYYGRIDIKYNFFEDLENDIDFKILEINGIISEPTHMYDSQKYSYFKALKTIRDHWRIIYLISSKNNSINKIKYKKISDFLNEIYLLNKYIKKIKKLI